MRKIFLLVFVVCMVEAVSAAHFIVGEVKDSYDGGEVANGKEVVLWNPANGIDDNLTDTVGPTGNSNTDNVYMIDCELLNSGCKVGDEIRVRLVYDGQEVNLSVSGAGFDIAPNITVNSKPNVTSIFVDDGITIPAQQVDLIAASTRKVTCEIIVEDYDGDNLKNFSSEFYSSSQGAGDDNNDHYTNNSCFANSSYGHENETQFICDFEVWYYANPGNWNCFFNVEDNHSAAANDTNITTMNTLLSVGVQNTINYTASSVGEVSDEAVVNVTNYGNVMVNMSLTSYGNAEGDGLAMDCTISDISFEHQKYNLTDSNPGNLDLGQAEQVYVNMSDKTIIKEFNLDYRTGNEDSLNSTYWRIYVPLAINGDCNGYIIFGASQDSGT
jgi:hypothetical protein